MRLVGGLVGETTDHLEVVRGAQLLQDREIHRPGWVSGGDQDAEDLLTVLEAGTLARLQSGDKGPAIGEGGPEVDVRDRTPLVRVRPFSILKRQGVLAIRAATAFRPNGPGCLPRPGRPRHGREAPSFQR